MRRSLLLLPFCLMATLLAGCGQKGPLVLPTRPAAATAPAAPAAAASSAAPSGSQP
ncbi:MAG: lipoprotein [Xanthomonadaceae bacterium]|nr:lipoprotein [Xanthomonadaceae bacterium]MDE3072726.1 lipoprotein [Pseudomonadota bacterium]